LVHGKAHDDILSCRNAARDTTRMIGQEKGSAIAMPHLIGVFLTGESSRGETLADLDTLDRIDAHHGCRNFGIKLA